MEQRERLDQPVSGVGRTHIHDKIEIVLADPGSEKRVKPRPILPDLDEPVIHMLVPVEPRVWKLGNPITGLLMIRRQHLNLEEYSDVTHESQGAESLQIIVHSDAKTWYETSCVRATRSKAGV